MHTIKNRRRLLDCHGRAGAGSSRTLRKHMAEKRMRLAKLSARVAALEREGLK